MRPDEEIERLIKLGRALTYEEYKWVKSSIEYYYQIKIFDAHIGVTYRKLMGSNNRHPGRTKYPLYKAYYLAYNSKLGRMVR